MHKEIPLCSSVIASRYMVEHSESPPISLTERLLLAESCRSESTFSSVLNDRFGEKQTFKLARHLLEKQFLANFEEILASSR